MFSSFIISNTKQIFHMKKLILFALFIFSFNAIKSQTNIFKHPWDIKYLEHDIQFISKKQAPIPFSTTGEPQAIMFVGATKLDSSSEKDLRKIVNSEIDDIRKQISLDEYLEDDYKPSKNLVLYYDQIGNIEIAVIKYRTNGLLNEQKVMPRSARHILFIKNNMLYNSTLTVLLA